MSRIYSRCIWIVVFFLGVAVVAGAGGPAASEPVSGVAEGGAGWTFDEDEGPLGQAMSALGRDFRGLRRSLRGGDLEAALERVPRMQSNILTAKVLTPHDENGKDVSAELQTEFRMQLIRAMRELLALEESLLQKNQEKITAAVGRLREIQEAGHKKFKVDDD